MSRTYRKSRVDKVYKEGQYGNHIVYKCKCEYCRSKKVIEEKIADRELKEGIDYMYGDTILDEWDAIEEYWNKNPLTLEEEMEWEKYRNVA